jgi:hypothetical protein
MLVIICPPNSTAEEHRVHKDNHCGGRSCGFHCTSARFRQGAHRPSPGNIGRLRGGNETIAHGTVGAAQRCRPNLEPAGVGVGWPRRRRRSRRRGPLPTAAGWRYGARLGRRWGRRFRRRDVAAQSEPTFRGFLPWRLSDDGAGCSWHSDGPSFETLHKRRHARLLSAELNSARLSVKGARPLRRGLFKPFYE